MWLHSLLLALVACLGSCFLQDLDISNVLHGMEDYLIDTDSITGNPPNDLYSCIAQANMMTNCYDRARLKELSLKTLMEKTCSVEGTFKDVLQTLEKEETDRGVFKALYQLHLSNLMSYLESLMRFVDDWSTYYEHAEKVIDNRRNEEALQNQKSGKKLMRKNEKETEERSNAWIEKKMKYLAKEYWGHIKTRNYTSAFTKHWRSGNRSKGDRFLFNLDSPNLASCKFVEELHIIETEWTQLFNGAYPIFQKLRDHFNTALTFTDLKEKPQKCSWLNFTINISYGDEKVKEREEEKEETEDEKIEPTTPLPQSSECDNPYLPLHKYVKLAPLINPKVNVRRCVQEEVSKLSSTARKVLTKYLKQRLFVYGNINTTDSIELRKHELMVHNVPENLAEFVVAQRTAFMDLFYNVWFISTFMDFIDVAKYYLESHERSESGIGTGHGIIPFLQYSLRPDEWPDYDFGKTPDLDHRSRKIDDAHRLEILKDIACVEKHIKQKSTSDKYKHVYFPLSKVDKKCKLFKYMDDFILQRNSGDERMVAYDRLVQDIQGLSIWKNSCDRKCGWPKDPMVATLDFISKNKCCSPYVLHDSYTPYPCDEGSCRSNYRECITMGAHDSRRNSLAINDILYEKRWKSYMCKEAGPSGPNEPHPFQNVAQSLQGYIQKRGLIIPAAEYFVSIKQRMGLFKKAADAIKNSKYSMCSLKVDDELLTFISYSIYAYKQTTQFAEDLEYSFKNRTWQKQYLKGLNGTAADYEMFFIDGEKQMNSYLDLILRNATEPKPGKEYEFLIENANTEPNWLESPFCGQLLEHENDIEHYFNPFFDYFKRTMPVEYQMSQKALRLDFVAGFSNVALVGKHCDLECKEPFKKAS